MATVEQMECTDAWFPDVHQNGEAMAALAAGAHDILGYDAIMPVFSVVQEAAALGCEMSWGTGNAMPDALTHPWRDPDDVTMPSNFLDAPPIRAVLDAIRRLKHSHGDRVAVVGKVMGPWTLSYHMHGIQDFLADTLLDPERVQAFLHRLKAVTLCFGQAQIDAGADALCLAEHATGDLVRGTMYRDFLLPIHRELTRALHVPVILHICGDTLDRIGFIAQAGFAAFHFDSKVDAKAAVEAAGGDLALVGNVNNPELLLRGSPQTVAEAARCAAKAGVRVVGPECAVPLQTPTANLQAIVSAVR